MANLVNDVMQTIDNTSANMVNNIYGGFAAELLPFVRNLLTISLILFGMGMMMGWVEYPVRQFLKRVFNISIALLLAFNWPIFDLYIYQVFTNGPDYIGGLALNSVGAGPATDISTQVGDLLETGIIASGAAFSADGWVLPYILGAIIFIFVLLICGFTLALLALSKIAMTVVLAVGPLFFIFLMFEPTRQMFSSWMQQVFNFAFIAILTYIVIAFFLQLLDNSIAAIPLDDPQLKHVAPLTLVGFVGTFVLWQIPGIASGLAGGVQVGTMGVFSAMGRQLQRMRPGGGIGRGAPQKIRDYVRKRRRVNRIRSK